MLTLYTEVPQSVIRILELMLHTMRIVTHTIVTHPVVTHVLWSLVTLLSLIILQSLCWIFTSVFPWEIDKVSSVQRKSLKI